MVCLYEDNLLFVVHVQSNINARRIWQIAMLCIIMNTFTD